MIGYQVVDLGNAAKGCDFCRFALKDDKDNWIIWVQNCNTPNTQTGLPNQFEVYVQPKPGAYGHHKTYDTPTCGGHAWQAFVVMQETYADEVKECERTEWWLEMRNSRI